MAGVNPKEDEGPDIRMETLRVSFGSVALYWFPEGVVLSVRGDVVWRSWENRSEAPAGEPYAFAYEYDGTGFADEQEPQLRLRREIRVHPWREVPLYTHPAGLIAAETGGTFKRGDRVTKIKGSSWTGRVVGFYSTALTPEGYAIESENEPGSVQIFPVSALAAAPATSGFMQAPLEPSAIRSPHSGQGVFPKPDGYDAAGQVKGGAGK